MCDLFSYKFSKKNHYTIYYREGTVTYSMFRTVKYNK